MATKGIQNKKENCFCPGQCKLAQKPQVKDFVAKHQKRTESLYIPSYSPDLNPIERVRKHLRYHVAHNVYFETLEFDFLNSRIRRFKLVR